ncbi:hypothetical protein N0V90_006810 [Kalmusia sp. IMI 367209]|nr:hypothetical protein N0V90_006810 [Kalmusia sp. IMI 367209]
MALLFFIIVFSEPKRAPSDCTLKEKIVKMDLPGTTLFVTSIVLLFVALEFGGNRSGLRLLPYTVSVNGGELLVGTASSFLGVFLPFMYLGTCLFTIAAGLFCTLRVDSPTGRLIWNQILAGLGVGSSMQLCATSVRAAIDKKDIPTAAILSVFAPFFGSALGATIGQNIFRKSLQEELLKSLTSSETKAVIAAGGTAIKYVTTSQTVGPVKEAYNHALKNVFILATVAGGIAFFGTLCIKWRTLREKTTDSSSKSQGANEDLVKTKDP